MVANRPGRPGDGLEARQSLPQKEGGVIQPAGLHKVLEIHLGREPRLVPEIFLPAEQVGDLPGFSPSDVLPVSHGVVS